jgi:hypothetical protein
MGQDPDAIRQEIEQTRMEMTETVDAIGHKADVPSRAREAVSERMDTVKAKVGGTASRAKDAIAGTTSSVGDGVSGATASVSDTTPSRGEVKRTARRAVGLVQENPLGMAIGAVAVGFLAGLAAPSTRLENQRLGPVADRVKDKVKETGQETLDRGKEVAQRSVQTAAQTAKEQGRQHGQELAQSAKQSADDLW